MPRGYDRLVSRRSLLASAALLAVVALLVAASGPNAGEVEAERAAPHLAAAAHRTAYARAREQGQPVAVLTRATVLRSSPGGRRIAKLRRRTEFRSPRVLAAVEERGTWLRVMAAQVRNGHTGWIPASAAVVVVSRWAVRADLSRREVVVRNRGRVVRRFPVAIGRPSTPTPTGTFAVTDKLYIEGAAATYGCCALALTGHQPHIEPGWRGGDRLAIHGGSPGTIGSAASFGCLRARDADVRWIVRHVYLGSLVEIRP
jgi:lipoprotein-anchoring transpeptidase ErfK/SrfK